MVSAAFFKKEPLDIQKLAFGQVMSLADKLIADQEKQSEVV
jgi:hypothetical protein